MLELGVAVLGWINYWFNGSQAEIELTKLQPLVWQTSPVFTIAADVDEQTEKAVQQYLERLNARGIDIDRQGIIIRSDWVEFAAHRSTEPASAASLTKLATSLAALNQWGAQHQFVTKIYTVGKLNADGVLQGDLIVQGSGDPLLVWQEAIALGSALQQAGIRQINGNLIVVEQFWLNYNNSPAQSGQSLRQAWNQSLWSNNILQQYQSLPVAVTKPQIKLDGEVKVATQIPDSAELFLRHQSLPLIAILQQMNIYSNNKVAQMLADLIGGADTVASVAATVANVPTAEIQLINGSGLGVENRISPRAAVAMLMAIQDHLNPQWSLGDVLPVGGRDESMRPSGDRRATLQERNIPSGTAVKTGSLWQVSALAGMIPTSQWGEVWFAIINHGNGGIVQFRQDQDRLLEEVTQNWQSADSTSQNSETAIIGDPRRNIVAQEDKRLSNQER